MTYSSRLLFMYFTFVSAKPLFHFHPNNLGMNFYKEPGKHHFLQYSLSLCLEIIISVRFVMSATQIRNTDTVNCIHFIASSFDLIGTSSYSILFTYLYMAPLAVKTNQRRPPVR